MHVGWCMIPITQKGLAVVHMNTTVSGLFTVSLASPMSPELKKGIILYLVDANKDHDNLQKY